jgi:phage tail sheath protein FI
MPITPTYPGVYIEELPSGVRTIAGVSTSVTAFIGRTQRGPADKATLIHSYADYERLFGGLWAQSSVSYAVQQYFLNGGVDAVIVRVHNGATAATLQLSNLTLAAANPGTWGRKLQAIVDHNTRDSTDNTLFNLTIEDTGTGAREAYVNLSVAPESPRFVTSVLRDESQLVRVSGSVASVSPTDTDPANPVTADASSGGDGSAVTDTEINGSASDPKKGLYALDNADIFNLLCIPPYHYDPSLSNPDPTSTAWNAAIAYCKKRRAMLIIDPPMSWDTKEEAKLVDDASFGVTRHENAILYFPRIRVRDPLQENRLGTFAPCGAVAGVMARTDGQRGVWKAPAGIEASVIGAVDVSVPLTDEENGDLNPLGINCLRSLPVIGRVVWGSRTLRGADRLADQWKYVPIRRLALYIEESLYRGTQWAVFEPNDEPLWATIRLNLGAFMHGLFRQGAFQGTSPKDAYFVKCDKESTTQADIDKGVVNVIVGFAPLKPAEFVVIRLQQMAGQLAT